MSDAVRRIDHDDMCCDQTDPHLHLEQQGEVHSFRLGKTEWIGATLDDVLAAVDTWLNERPSE